MDQHNYHTETLWKAFFSTLMITILGAVMLFGYLLLEEEIRQYINRPVYTQDQLNKIAKNREVSRNKERADNWDLVENGIHVKTGLKSDPNLKLIISSCTSCHSAKLITQNRATRQGWKSMIDWMQETQGLNDLGDKEPIILDYLAEYYAPTELGRRENLDIETIEWYILNLEESN